MSIEINVINEIVQIDETSEVIQINASGGIGVPSGGLTNQFLAKNSNTNYDFKWANVLWGQVSGTLSAQTDLQNALNAKVPTSRILTINGVAFDLSQNRAWTIDALPSQTGNSGKYLTTNGSVASWGTIDLSGFVLTSRTLTINGTTYDLSADRSWTIASGNIYNTNGTLTSARTLTSGGFPLTFTGTNTAATAIARGLNLTHTLVASSNNDVLVGLDINPTFTNGAFSGVENINLRLVGSGSRSIKFQAGDSFGQANITSDISSTLNIIGGFNGINFKFNNGTNVSSVARITHNDFSPLGGDNIVGLGGLQRWRLVNSVLVSSDAYQFQGTTAMSFTGLVDTGIYFDLTNKILRFSTNNSEKFRVTSAGRLLLGTTTESTFLLDVNGTARVSGVANFDSLINANANITSVNSSIFGVPFLSIKSVDSANPLYNQDWQIRKPAHPTQYLSFYNVNTASDRMVIFNGVGTGVGINTNVYTGFTLEVNGTVKTAAITATGLSLTGGSINDLQFPNFRFRGFGGNIRIETSIMMGFINTTDSSLILSNQDLGGVGAVASALFELKSNNRGFLPPRMTTAERGNIANPATGLVVYDTTQNSLNVYDGATWRSDEDTITTNRQTASYSLVLADRGKLVEMNSASANTLTVPLNSSIAFPIGSKIDVTQYGAGATTITATGGVTIRSFTSFLKLAGQYAACTLVKIGTDEWYCYGNLIA